MRDAAPEYAGGTEFATLHNFSWSVFALSTAIQFCVGLLMWKRFKPSSVWIAIGSLWFCTLILAVGGHFVALSLVDAAFMPSDLKAFIVPLASAGIWSAYLLRSVRVQNTYGLKAV